MSEKNPIATGEHAEHRDVYPQESERAHYEGMSMGRYLATRLSTLKPPMEKVENPFKLLGLLNKKQWMFFLCSFFAWTWDAFDFFTVSLTVTDLAATFDKTKKDITWFVRLWQTAVTAC
jgi:SHS family lactate transporter-like MFS transporter